VVGYLLPVPRVHSASGQPRSEDHALQISIDPSVLKPLVRECVNEVLAEEGRLQACAPAEERLCFSAGRPPGCSA